MKRNIAFFISTNDEKDKDFIKAKIHIENLAKDFGYFIYYKKINNIKIFIIYDEKLTIFDNEDIIKWPIGNIGDLPLNYDRFLEIEVKNDKITIRNDYAGSIPVFYSLRRYLSLSNIEPCVVFDSNTSANDFSFENIYGFLKYSHFIWDETAYKHIYNMLPDSLYEFDVEKLSVNSKYLKTVRASSENVSLSDREVANKLYELNKYLVNRSLNWFEQIILPLSSGYDSRMIFSALTENVETKERLYCFTYGCEGSVEVEAARRLTALFNVNWKQVELPLQFLRKDYLLKIYNVFGSSLHMHGMYQHEFFNEIAKTNVLKGNSCLTSGFMTGVPAGQHNKLLGIKNKEDRLSEAMNKFSQSNFWTVEELEEIPVFKGKGYIEKAEERFRNAFDRFEGEIYQKSVMFDVWTRQRNFISYYPRTLEWCITTVSPHMTAEYANFFMSLSKRHLDNRLAVELMFSYHYPEIAKIISNSNGLKSIKNPVETLIFYLAIRLQIIKFGFLLPQKYRATSFEFDTKALRNSGEEGIFPLLENNSYVDSFMEKIITKETLCRLFQGASSGDVRAYNKLTTLQALSLSILNMEY